MDILVVGYWNYMSFFVLEHRILFLWQFTEQINNIFYKLNPLPDARCEEKIEDYYSCM